MTAQVISIDRRQYARDGIIGQLEDITYAVVRRYRVIGEIRNDEGDSPELPPAAIH